MNVQVLNIVCRDFAYRIFEQGLGHVLIRRFATSALCCAFISPPVLGIPFLIRVGLVLMHCCRRAILEFSSEESILNCLKRPSAHWLPATPEAFISLVLAVRLKDDAVRKQRTKMEAQVKRQTQTTRMMSNAPISLPRS